jgi:hypothetical protein
MPAGVASADDNSVYGAYVSRDSDFTRLGKQLKKDIKAWVRSGRKDSQAALSTISETKQVIGDVAGAIKAEQPSSDNGKRGKAKALASVRHLGGSLTALARGIRERTAGHVAAARRLARKTDRLVSRSLKEERQARKAFKAAGVQIKP